MISPPVLRNGDTVAIVAPGRKVTEQELKIAVETLSSWGLSVVKATHLFSNAHSYLSGTDNERRSDLQFMLDNPAFQAVICARGGYGTTRILDGLDFESFKKNPKWVVGFSDVTSLHLKLVKLGYESIHATMPILFPESDAVSSVQSLKNALFGGIVWLDAPIHPLNRLGVAEGQVVGGNLSLIVDTLGTSTSVDTANKILVIEEIDEYRYRIDRMIMQLKRAGQLQHLAGLVVGHMTDIKDTTTPFAETVAEIILNHTKEFGFPVAFQFSTGHENPNLAWIHGRKAQLQVGENGSTLRFTSHATG